MAEDPASLLLLLVLPTDCSKGLTCFPSFNYPPRHVCTPAFGTKRSTNHVASEPPSTVLWFYICRDYVEPVSRPRRSESRAPGGEVWCMTVLLLEITRVVSGRVRICNYKRPRSSFVASPCLLLPSSYPNGNWRDLDPWIFD